MCSQGESGPEKQAVPVPDQGLAARYRSVGSNRSRSQSPRIETL